MIKGVYKNNDIVRSCEGRGVREEPTFARLRLATAAICHQIVVFVLATACDEISLVMYKMRCVSNITMRMSNILILRSYMP